MQLHQIASSATSPSTPAPWSVVGSVSRSIGIPGNRVDPSVLYAQDTPLASMTLDMALVLARQSSLATETAPHSGMFDAMGVAQAADGTFLVQRLDVEPRGTREPLRITGADLTTSVRVVREGTALLAVVNGDDARVFDEGASSITFGASRTEHPRRARHVR